MKLDVEVENDAKDAAEAVSRVLGDRGLDYLINNAGVVSLIHFLQLLWGMKTIDLLLDGGSSNGFQKLHFGLNTDVHSERCRSSASLSGISTYDWEKQ